MSRCILEIGENGRVEILRTGAGRRLFDAFVERCPHSIRLMHVKWSGDALFFVLDLGITPGPEEKVDWLRPGEVTYYPELEEVIIPYGVAAPRNAKGTVAVAPFGRTENVEALTRAGRSIWRKGTERGTLRHV